MNETQRAGYLALGHEIDWSLCTFCQYHFSYSSPCNGGNDECEHPLFERIDPDGELAWPGEDCWGFRPKYPIEDCADMVGIVLSERFDPDRVMWEESDDRERIVKVLGNVKGE